MRIASIFLLLTINPVMAIADNLKTFTTDGCSSFPDGTISQQSLWLDCCVKHDLAYWKGGSYDERMEADLSLRNCVAKVGKPEIADIMLAGVRIGGSPYFPTSYRWGYGWSFPRGYKKLTTDELIDVSNKLEIFMQIVASISQQVEAEKNGLAKD
ncbi:MAG: hypothetical protein OEY87_00880 [Gammaproteobacteria bacterium]|nr:hypothetical protein [Gammaproteobacteria bacterium]MDH5734649.1 hypothetical protein [Gammaproteobacteria bacterium]